MSARLLLDCDGCDAEATSEPLRRHSVPFRRGGEFVVYRYDEPDDVAPEGWQVHDPYTGCTYCPTCWADIVSAASDDGLHRPHGEPEDVGPCDSGPLTTGDDRE